MFKNAVFYARPYRFYMLMLVCINSMGELKATNFTSSTAIQVGTDVTTGDDKEILQVQVVATGGGPALLVCRMDFTMQNTDDADVNEATLYYTGTSGTFSTAEPLGTAVTDPTGTISFTFSKSTGAGTFNYWLAFDIDAGSAVCNNFDATYDVIFAGGSCPGTSETITTTDPAGDRTIAGPGCWTYCSAVGTTSTPGHIKRVQFNTIDNTTGFDGYVNTGVSTTVKQGEFYNLIITGRDDFAGGPMCYTAAWIDFNNDGDFTDFGENVAPDLEYGSTGVQDVVRSTVSVQVPVDAFVGTTKMRVFFRDENTPEDGCGDYTFEDVEDYDIVINAGSNMTYSAGNTVLVQNAATIDQGEQGDIIRIEITTGGGGLTPLNATNFDFNTTGTDDVTTNVNSARLYYNGVTNDFSTATQTGLTIFDPNGNFTISPSQPLFFGVNYFWLAYEIATTADAATPDVVDAQCVTVDVGAVTDDPPAPTSPAGTRTITAVTAPTYCEPEYTDDADDYIDDVTFNTISNLSTGDEIVAPDTEDGWTDYSGTHTTSVVKGSTYLLTVGVYVDGSFASPQHCYVWFDWNQDDDFTDAGEEYLIGYAQGDQGVHSISKNILIPTTAFLGTTKFRISERYAAVPTPCDNPITFGESEDYGLTITEQPDCSGSPESGSVTPSTQIIATGDFTTLTVFGYSSSANITLQWQESDDDGVGDAWANVVGGMNATSATYTTASLSANLYYRCVVTCETSSSSSNTSSALVKVSSNVYKTVTSTGTRFWGTAADWVGGSAPPIDGTADVIIQAASGAYSAGNSFTPNVAFDVNSITVENGANLATNSLATLNATVGDVLLQGGGYIFGNNHAVGGYTLTLSIKGDFTCNGIMKTRGTTNPKSVVLDFSGAGAQTISGSGTFQTMGETPSSLVISNGSAAGVTIDIDIAVNNANGDGSITVNSGSKLTFADASDNFSGTGTLTLNGIAEMPGTTFNSHFGMSGTRTISTTTSKLIFTNVATSLIPSTDIPSGNLFDMEYNSTGGSLTLGGNVDLAGTLTLTDGNMVLGTNNVVITSGNAITGGSPTSYIQTNSTGVLTINSVGATARTFPVGKSTYNPVVIDNSAGVADNFSVRVYDAVTDDGTEGGTAYTADVVDRTWLITEGTGGGSDVILDLQWGSADEFGTFNRANCHVSHYTGGAWDHTHAFGDEGPDGDPYIIRRTSITSFSPFAISDENGPLPISLTHFSAEKGENGNLVSVSWSTSSELNNDFFTIEKSKDGAEFDVLEVIPGAGTSNVQREYSLTDSNPFLGYNYYRLKQTDFDGAFTYSQVERVYFSADNNLLFEISDTKESISVINLNDSKEPYLAQVMDVSGKMVALFSGNGHASVNKSDFSSGVYFLQLTMASGKVVARKFLVR